MGNETEVIHGMREALGGQRTFQEQVSRFRIVGLRTVD